MLAAIIWGLVQGLTEFLPVSSSGHLVVVPELLDRFGLDIGTPDLATSAVLHLGTLLAVLVYFRADILKVLQMRDNEEGRRIAQLVAVGTIPAGLGYFVRGSIEDLQENLTAVGVALIATGLILVFGQLLATGHRQLKDGRVPDALVVGVAQALALIPGISRSGVTITAGNSRQFEPTEAARYSFLLGIPAIAAAGLFSISDLGGSGFSAELMVGLAVAAVSGYAAIAFLLALIRKVGLLPFAAYCFVIGIVTITYL